MQSLNFTLSTWFHFGVIQEEEAPYSALISRQPGLHKMEDRLDNFHIPSRMHIDGPPDLVIFDSSYVLIADPQARWRLMSPRCPSIHCRFWDSDYFGSRAWHIDRNPVIPNMRYEGLTFSELQHHRRRIAAMISHLRMRFPNVPIMWKPAHLRAKNAHTKGVESEPTVSFRYAWKRAFLTPASGLA